MNQHIVLIEDEDKIGKMICAYLEKEGYRVDWYQNGLTGWKALENEEPDLVVLDLMLPGMPGTEICQRLRKKGSPVSIIMLTARGEESDRIAGLELGADDYLVKPFSLRELVARIQAILRRSNANWGSTKQQLTYTSEGKILELDLTKQTVTIDGELKDLTATEFKLLALLAQNPDRPFTREEMIVKLQGYDYEGFDRTVDAHVKNLRRKLDLSQNQFIVTIYRIGYKFTAEEKRNA